jgi:hypothetical protein
MRGTTHLTRPGPPNRGIRHRRPSDTPKDRHASYRITLDIDVGTTAGILGRARQATQ